MRTVVKKLVLIVLTVSLLCTTVLAEDNTAPKLTISEESGSTLQVGDKVVATFNDDSKIAEVNYRWDNDEEKTETPNTNIYKMILPVVPESGEHVLYLEAIDEEGNSTGEKSFEYYIESTDKEAPTLTVSEESESTLAGGTQIVLTIKDESKIAKLNYHWGNASTKTKTPNVETYRLNLTLGYAPGDHILYAEAIDVEGNSSGEKSFTYYVKDENKPEISLDKNDGSTLEAGAKIVVSVEDESKITEVTYKWNNETVEKSAPNKDNTEFTVTLGDAAGKHVLTVTATDEEGNKVVETYTFYVEEEEIEEDNDAPVVTVSEKSESTVAGGTEIIFNIKDASNVAKLKYYWVGQDAVTEVPNTNLVKFTMTIGTEGGKHVLHLEAIDEHGNSTGDKTYVYYVDVNDEKAPEITLNQENGSTLPGGANIRVTVDDESRITKILYNWAGSNEKTRTPNVNTHHINLTLGTEPGKHVLYVTAIDEKGNNTGKQMFTFYVEGEDKDAPTIKVTPEDGSTLPGGTAVKVTVEDESLLEKVIYNWAGNKEKTLTNKVNTQRINLTLGTEPGKHVLYVTAIDEKGNSTGKQAFTYYIEAEDNEKPTIEVSPEDGSEITPDDDVKVTLKDKEGLAKVEYAWDDQTPVKKPISGKDVTLTMPDVPEEPGKHTLHVTVTDEAGNMTSEDFDFYVPEQDDEDPTITMNPKSKTTVAGGKIIKATLRDNLELKTVEYHWDDDDTTTKTLTGALKTISLPAISKKPGTYYMHIKLTDAAGNTTGWETHIYYVEDDDDDGDGEDPEVFADPDGGDVEYGDRITLWAEDDDGIEYIEYYWDDDDDDTTIKYDDEFTIKVPSEEGEHDLYVRAMDEVGDRCGWEKFVYNIEENNYPGNPDIQGEINDRVRNVRVEIRNADDKIKFEPEEEILYYVDYYNGGNSKLTNAKLVVELPTYLKAKKASDDGKISSNKVTWSLGTLKAGEYGRVSFTAEYTSDKYNEKIITIPAKIYSGTSLKDTSTVRNLIYCDDANGTGAHNAYCIGYPDGSFRANGNITRAELAQMIANIEGISGSYRGQFSDLARDHWAANAIQACVDKGYVLPVGYNSFAPERPATRGELAYAIAAALGVQDLEPIFICSTDLKNSDYRCSMEQLLRLGIMDGYSNGTARPNSSVTRAEAVTIINNYLFRGELIVSGYGYGYGHTYNYDTGYNYGGNGTVLSFTDLSTNHWAYGHIMEATNNHRYERIMDGNEKML